MENIIASEIIDDISYKRDEFYDVVDKVLAHFGNRLVNTYQ